MRTWVTPEHTDFCIIPFIFHSSADIFHKLFNFFPILALNSSELKWRVLHIDHFLLGLDNNFLHIFSTFLPSLMNSGDLRKYHQELEQNLGGIGCMNSSPRFDI